MSQTMTARHWLALISTAFLFGSSFFFIKLAVEDIPPLTLAAVRAGIAAGVVLAFVLVRGEALPRIGRGWIPLVVLGLLTASIPFAAIAFGQQTIDSSLGGILFATIPVFSVLMAPMALDEEHYDINRLLGAAIGFGGVVVIVGLESGLLFSGQALGAFLTLAGALSYALGGIYARRQTAISPTIMASGQLIVATIVLGAASLALESPTAIRADGMAAAAVLGVALFSTALPTLMLFWLVRTVGATNTSLLAFFMPVSAILLGVILLGETVGWREATGLILIVAGVSLVTGRPGLRRKSA